MNLARHGKTKCGSHAAQFHDLLGEEVKQSKIEKSVDTECPLNVGDIHGMPDSFRPRIG